MDAWTWRLSAWQVWCYGRGNYRQFCFSGLGFLVSSLCQGECFAPLPGRLGRFTSGQELQVWDNPKECPTYDGKNVIFMKIFNIFENH